MPSRLAAAAHPFPSDPPAVKIASFNINGITARLPRLLEWLAEARPDIVGLQEIKIEETRFPRQEIEAAGYQLCVHGQKGFNGVAILARHPIHEISRSLSADSDASDDDIQSRWLEARIGDIHFVCLYLPNGNPVPGPKFDYKLAWMDRLAARARVLLASEAPVILAGDWNVCPTDADVARPEIMADDALVQPQSRSRFRALTASGWTDAIRAANPDATVYSYWDYQGGAWPKNWGLRIDHLLLSPAAADRMRDCGIDSHVRGRERPSDHVPVWVTLD